MRAAWSIAVLLVAGCTASNESPSESEDSDGDGFVDAVEDRFDSDPRDNASRPMVERTQAVEFSDSVRVVGTGVPGVQCPADQVNSQRRTWTVAADTGDARRAWATDLSVRLSGAMTVNDVDLFVYGPDGSLLDSATGSTNAEAIDLGGEQPLGDYSIEARGCSGAGDVAVEASGVVHWIPSDAELLASN